MIKPTNIECMPGMEKKLFENFVLFLCISYLFLLPFGRISGLSIIIMAVFGIFLLLKKMIKFENKALIYYGLIFLLSWIPIILSLPDAVSTEKTLEVTAVFLRLYFSGIFIIYAFQFELVHKYFLPIGAAIILFWVGDALIQAVFGNNIFGYDLVPGRLNGIFGERNPKFGIYLASLCPLLLVYVGRHWPPVLQVSILVAVAIVIFLAGSRGGWVMFAVVLAAMFSRMLFLRGGFSLRWLLVAMFAFLSAGAGVYLLSSSVAARVDQSLLVFSGDREAIDIAISRRLPIWETALHMIEAHPINGVGARGFRYAYPEFAGPQDPFVDAGVGAFHAHQLFLDVAGEAGVIGFVGLILVFVVLIYVWAKAGHEQKRRMLPYGLALVAVFFPINTHFSFYSSDWSAFLFWLIALYCSESQGLFSYSNAIVHGDGVG